MRALFYTATGWFWVAVMAFAVAGTSTAPTAPSAQTPAAAPQARITLAEVARHATEADCWMAIHGNVYDLTAYLPEHPSRPSAIVPWCGREATEAYKTKNRGRPHSPDADQLLPAYRIGVLATP